MDILEKICLRAKYNGEAAAIQSKDGMLTYGQLEDYSNRLAAYIEDECQADRSPVVVYGHKNPYMIVCFLACVKSGRAYCPVDTSVPESRVQAIIDAVSGPILLEAEPLSSSCKKKVGLDEIMDISRNYHKFIEKSSRVRPEDIFYIIFTSGSTGVPKGVQITTGCLNHFLDWSVNLGTPLEEKEGKVFLNQAPFSFDLSVMDVYTSLACGGQLWALDKATQGNYASLLESLGRSKTGIWVSTPSFADICLTDHKFNQQLMPEMELFLFCGETLTNSTAQKLMQRFPNARIFNTYGPTESTVAITSVEITGELNRTVSPLPVGCVKPGTKVAIYKSDGTEAPEGERGEIHIIGDTVSPGYFKQPEQTGKFFYDVWQDCRTVRAYRTGDEGYLKDGLLYYCGRIDLQVKLHGYRIELEDIESNILKLDGINNAVVVPRVKQGQIKSLAAFIIYDKKKENDKEVSREIKGRLKQVLPDYMIPKKLVFIDKMPVTVNGKADRKYLGGLLA